MRIAVIGSGVSGLTAAYVISRRHEVTLYERDRRFGGHANTVAVQGARGRVGLDTGFIVHNERTYPHLLRLFGELGVATQASDMSFGVRCEQCGLEYAGARGLAGVAARPSRLLRPEYLRMLAEVRRFHRHARQLLRDTTADRMTLGEFLERGRYSQYFHDHFLLPLTGAVWSCGPRRIREFPARYLVRFFANHGMLTIKHAPAWKTVTGGSGVYVRAVVGALHDTMSDTEVVAVERDARGVTVTDAGGRARRFDRVVIATHPDQALRLLGDPTDDERSVLGAFRYSRNETLLHTDARVLPAARRARASWNYRMAGCSEASDDVQVSYWMNRLQNIDEPLDYLVTLNATDRIEPGTVLRRMVYEHPVYSPSSVAAQRQLLGLNTGRTAFAGAYHGWGFHEDGCASGVRAAEAFGAGW